jgi:hypothetical protein
MPNTFISASIATGLTIEAGHVTQSADAFTGTEAYDITISGSLTNTGSLDVSGSVGISGNTTIGGTLTAANATINNAVLSGSTDITGSIVVTGSLTVSGSGTFNNIGPFNQTGDSGFIGTHRMSSSASPSIVSVLTENDSFPFIQSSPTTGPNFRMDLADANSSGSAHISLGRQTGLFGGTGFLARYATGSSASQGEIIMALGKNGLLGAQEDRFIVQSEPGRIVTNGNSELTLSVGGPTTGRRQVLGNVQDGTGEFANFAAGIDNQFGRKRFVSFEYSSNSTSSQAGFFSSSLAGTGVPNFNTNAIPFGIVAGGAQTTDLTNTVFFIDRGGSVGATVPVTASFQISRGGSINMEGHITASGKIAVGSTIPAASGYSGITAKFNGGAFFNITEETTRVFGIYDSEDGADILRIDTDPDQFLIDPINNGINVGISNASPTEKLTILGNVSASGNGIFKAGKPITTHTSSPISSSNANAGGYHIVGGNLTASIVLDSTAPIGAEYEFFQTSSVGQFLFESASGTTVISKNGSLRLAQQGSSAVLKKVSTTTFHLMGDLT